MANIYDWSTTAGSNNSASPNGWPEGMPPSGVNDSARQMMAETAKWRDLISGAKTTSGTDTITLTSGATITSYTGLMFVAKLGGTNTGAATINIDSVGAVAVEIDGAAVGAGDLVSGKYYTFVYDGVAFQASRIGGAGFSDPLTTRGDIIYRDASATTRLALGTTGHVLQSDGTDVAYGQVATAGITDDAVTLAKMAAGTAGNLITYDASGDPAAVATGTATHVLTSNGAGAAPTFQAAGGGAWDLVQRDTSISGASHTITGLDSASYSRFQIFFEGLAPATDARLHVRLGTSGGVNSGANYDWVTWGHHPGNAPSGTQERNAAQFPITNWNYGGGDTRVETIATAGYDGVSGFFEVMNAPNITGANIHVQWRTTFDAASAEPGTVCNGGGTWNNSGTFDRIQFFWEGGYNFANQTGAAISVVGLKES